MELIQIKNNKPITTSLMVAEKFGKRHDNVVRAIESIDDKEFSKLNFESAQYIDKQGVKSHTTPRLINYFTLSGSFIFLFITSSTIYPLESRHPVSKAKSAKSFPNVFNTVIKARNVMSLVPFSILEYWLLVIFNRFAMYSWLSPFTCLSSLSFFKTSDLSSDSVIVPSMA